MTTPTTTTPTCTCGNQACAVRARRGLVPFCKMPAPAPRVLPGYPTYAAAALAAKPGQVVRLISGGGTTGSPKRFAPVAIER